ncbi:MAG: response regulator, partial [Alphaproteobacteria bacterium]
MFGIGLHFCPNPAVGRPVTREGDMKPLRIAMPAEPEPASDAALARRILIVEDNYFVAHQCRSALLDAGYDVVDVVITADDAVRAAMDRRPELVLMDIYLPGKRDGIDAAVEIFQRFFRVGVGRRRGEGTCGIRPTRGMARETLQRPQADCDREVRSRRHGWAAAGAILIGVGAFGPAFSLGRWPAARERGRGTAYARRWLIAFDPPESRMAKLGTFALVGASGRRYEFGIYLREDAFKPLGAVYFLAKRIPFAEREAEYTWIYVGEAADISRRPLAGEQEACVDANEANCLCLCMEEDAQARAAIVA